ncbi:MAG: class II aldolase/adducin family protein [Desulforhabdus sp.]|jgi:L-fuculose-phosphate aldolase|nr:class II aldolase/adducin family protein [Desulforhabdus sp.]
MMNETGLREDLIWVCRQLEKQRLLAATDGNVSCRVGPDRLLITPSGARKGELKPLDLILVDLNSGSIVAGRGKASSELRVHFLIYRQRPDVNAVVHAHPPLLTGCTLAGIQFRAEVLPEVWLTIGSVPTAPYAMPTTEELAESVRPFLANHQAILLERHGSLTVGRSLKEAFMRLEKLEHAAHTLLFSYLLSGNPPSPLPEAALAALARNSKRVIADPAPTLTRGQTDVIRL